MTFVGINGTSLCSYPFFTCCVRDVVGERSEPPSEKLGGEIFIASHVLGCLSL